MLIWCLNKSVSAGTMDNITCVIIAFNNFIEKSNEPEAQLTTSPTAKNQIPESLTLDVLDEKKKSVKTYVVRKQLNSDIKLMSLQPSRESPKIQKSRVIISKNMIKSKKSSKKESKQFRYSLNTKNSNRYIEGINIVSNNKNLDLDLKTRNLSKASKKISGSVISVSNLIKASTSLKKIKI